jgi:hypothetical protein
VLTAVDQGSPSSVSIAPVGGDPIRLKVDEKTRIAVDGQPATLGDLTDPAVMGKPAGALYDKSVRPPVARLILVVTQRQRPNGAP